MADPANPNEFNDGAFMAASQELRGSMDFESHVKSMWDAGATASDIRIELEEAANDVIADIA